NRRSPEAVRHPLAPDLIISEVLGTYDEPAPRTVGRPDKERGYLPPNTDRTGLAGDESELRARGPSCEVLTSGVEDPQRVVRVRVAVCGDVRELVPRRQDEREAVRVGFVGGARRHEAHPLVLRGVHAVQLVGVGHLAE